MHNGRTPFTLVAQPVPCLLRQRHSLGVRDHLRPGHGPHHTGVYMSIKTMVSMMCVAFSRWYTWHCREGDIHYTNWNAAARVAAIALAMLRITRTSHVCTAAA